MGDVVAIAALMLLAVFAFETAWRLMLVLLVLGPAACAAIVAGWFSATLGVEVPWALAIALCAGATVRGLTFWTLRFIVSAGSPRQDGRDDRVTHEA